MMSATAFAFSCVTVPRVVWMAVSDIELFIWATVSMISPTMTVAPIISRMICIAVHLYLYATIFEIVIVLSVEGMYEFRTLMSIRFSHVLVFASTSGWFSAT